MSQRKKLKLNVKFKNGNVICAKSPKECGLCKEDCEKINLFYYLFNDIDVKECFKNNQKRK